MMIILHEIFTRCSWKFF